MHEQLDLVPRRVGSKVDATPEQMDKQKRLHQLNLEYVAIRLHQGLPKKYFLMSDEYGQFLFPSGNVILVKKGITRPTSDMKEDKRQFTGDTCHNGDGQVVKAVQIWTGSTDASLPLLSIRQKFPAILFEHTSNHWANHDTKMNLLAAAWQWVCKEKVKDGSSGPPECVYFLDCWPVNLTARLRDEVTARFPGMVLRFIPAGATVEPIRLTILTCTAP
jgi:hypothetical protein